MRPIITSLFIYVLISGADDSRLSAQALFTLYAFAASGVCLRYGVVMQDGGQWRVDNWMTALSVIAALERYLL